MFIIIYGCWRLVLLRPVVDEVDVAFLVLPLEMVNPRFLELEELSLGFIVRPTGGWGSSIICICGGMTTFLAYWTVWVRSCG